MYNLKAASPRKMVQSESVERLIRTNRNFAIRPYLSQSERWSDVKMSKVLRKTEDGKRKKLIKDMDSSVHGTDFAAQEMAKVIRSWMSQED